MVGSKWFTIALTGMLVLTLRAGGSALADSNAGAKLVAQNGCTSCHGAKFQGSSTGFPALYGIEHRRSRTQIVDAIVHPTAPMPNYGFTPTQAGVIADYLSGLDGGASADQPVITIAPEHPSDYADVTIRFPGTPPKSVTAVASMSMGNMPMNSLEGYLFANERSARLYTGASNSRWAVHGRFTSSTTVRPSTDRLSSDSKCNESGFLTRRRGRDERGRACAMLRARAGERGGRAFDSSRHRCAFRPRPA